MPGAPAGHPAPPLTTAFESNTKAASITIAQQPAYDISIAMMTPPRLSRLRTIAVAAGVCILTASPADAGDAAPWAARDAGFATETFATAAFSPANVDQRLTYSSGRQWYLWNFFGWQPTAQHNALRANGVVENAASREGQLVTAAKSGNTFIGTAFGGGGYFEAEVAFDPRKVEHAKGWPSWWAMSLEHLISQGEQWPGEAPGYSHFIEIDALEYNRPADRGFQYGATVHDWFGILQKSCPGPRATFCHLDTPYEVSTKSAPPGTDWTKFHKAAFRWIPASIARPGSITFYLDGRQMGIPVLFGRYFDQPPAATWRPWTFGIVDQQHLVLVLGGSPAGMRIRSVHVWQKTASANLTR